MISSPPSSGSKLRRLRSPDEFSFTKDNRRRLDRDSPDGSSVDETYFQKLFEDDTGTGAVPVPPQLNNQGYSLPPQPSETSSSSSSSSFPNPSPPDEAPWSTRATILFAQGLVLTSIVGTVLFFCLRRHVQRSRRFAVQRARARRELMEWMDAMQERTTIRISSSAAEGLERGGRDTARGDADSEAVPVAIDGDDDAPSPRRSLLLVVPRAILSVLAAPFRALDDAVHSWSTERGGYDAQYFQSVMERIQREKEERMENPKEREVRLKEAFAKGRMVWELEDDCFVGPECGKGKQESVKEELVVPRHVEEEIIASESGRGDHGKESCDDLVEKEQQKDLSNEKDEDRNDKPSVEPQDLSRTSATSGTEVVSVEKESKQQLQICNDAECSKTENSKALEVQNLVATVDERHNGKESNDCPQVVETLTPNESAMAPRDNGQSNEFIYLAVPNRPRNRTVSEPSAQDILELAQSSSASASAPYPDEELRPSQLQHDDDDVSSTPPLRRPIPNQCAICLCDYEPGDTIVVSASSSLRVNDGDGTSATQRGNHCPHAFHQECIVEWLVKMQDGTPCPCCRQTFVELEDPIPHGANTRSGRATVVARASTDASTVIETSTRQGIDEAERARQERRRRHIELGIQRGGRAFDVSAISFGSRATEPMTTEELEEAARIRQERRRRHVELGIQRGGRAFDFSRISMR